MLGCQDFPLYNEWTYDYVRHHFGQAAVDALSADALGGESQAHYLRAAEAGGLRGLLETWVGTGEDEHCDWTFALDESRNVLRWDMRRCPSKLMLIDNDLAADTDFCDHCMGWMIPLLDKAGVEVAGHEHNHCGQCWGEMRVRGKPIESLGGRPTDVRLDPRWGGGYVERWDANAKKPYASNDHADPAEAVKAVFEKFAALTVLGRGPGATDERGLSVPRENVVVVSATYVSRDVFAGEPVAVMVGDKPSPQHIAAIAARHLATEPDRRPALLYPYLPSDLIEPANFDIAGLPRPLPVLPLLICERLYRHDPKRPYPTTGVFAVLVAVATRRPTRVAGIDLYRHASGKVYAADAEPADPGPYQWPDRHSRERDLACLQAAAEYAARHNVELDVLLPPPRGEGGGGAAR